jgi:glycosyltransferase involved in cell wall biosynthesis
MSLAIERYVDDDALARAHGRAARQRAEQRFSLERMVERYHRLYTTLVQSDVAPAPAAARRGHAPRP